MSAPESRTRIRVTGLAGWLVPLVGAVLLAVGNAGLFGGVL